MNAAASSTVKKRKKPSQTVTLNQLISSIRQEYNPTVHASKFDEHHKALCGEIKMSSKATSECVNELEAIAQLIDAELSKDTQGGSESQKVLLKNLKTRISKLVGVVNGLRRNMAVQEEKVHQMGVATDLVRSSVLEFTMSTIYGDPEIMSMSHALIPPELR
jgi:hypothetical protein